MCQQQLVELAPNSMYLIIHWPLDLRVESTFLICLAVQDMESIDSNIFYKAVFLNGGRIRFGIGRMVPPIILM